MIKLLLPLFSFAFLYGSQSVYLLPDEHSRMVHEVTRKIKTSSSKILLITPSFHHSEFKKSILSAAKKGAVVSVIVNTPKNDPLYMVQYSGIDLRLYTDRILSGSILLIDDRYYCTFSGALDQERFTSERSLMQCSDDANDIALLQKSLNTTLIHSHSYLE